MCIRDRPKPNAQRNFTDPDSRIMVRDGAFVQAYNAQIAVDEAHQIIVAAALSNQAPDAQYFEPMLRRTVGNCNAVPAVVTGDAGYFSVENVHAAEHMGTEILLSVGAHLSNGLPDDAPPPLQQLQSAERAAMRTPDAKPPSSLSSARSAPAVVSGRYLCAGS